ncbi:hypothetical protein HOY34_17220 [Xinfangfangia sp. D13-10-4-6]|uniref:hypothetical protein n=1 Tax=Pseudogemmobacter hezensis TaxID=2737662 RepID=UPI001551B13D|nr:hypothetical protein [Pseudogemmobacter hezensis]NPD16936.1 hypothetical protein [Pseudogemmobacter hezensis]
MRPIGQFRAASSIVPTLEAFIAARTASALIPWCGMMCWQNGPGIARPTLANNALMRETKERDVSIEAWKKAKQNTAEAEAYLGLIGKTTTQSTVASREGAGATAGSLTKFEITTQIHFQPYDGATNYHNCKAFDSALSEVVRKKWTAIATRPWRCCARGKPWPALPQKAALRRSLPIFAASSPPPRRPPMTARDGGALTRRVYMMDGATLAAIEIFRQRRGLASEVAAVRDLIELGTAHTETVGDLLNRYEITRNPIIFYGHPKVASIQQKEGRLSSVTMRNGAHFGIDLSGRAIHIAARTEGGADNG